MKLHSMKSDKMSGKRLSPGSSPMGIEHHGPTLHLDEGHMAQMGLKETFKPGDKVHFEGHAEVHAASGKDGKHSATLRVKKMGAEKHEDGSSLRSDIEKATVETGQKITKPKQEKLANEQDRGKDAGERTKGMGGS